MLVSLSSGMLFPLILHLAGSFSVFRPQLKSHLNRKATLSRQVSPITHYLPFASLITPFLTWHYILVSLLLFFPTVFSLPIKCQF